MSDLTPLQLQGVRDAEAVICKGATEGEREAGAEEQARRREMRCADEQPELL